MNIEAPKNGIYTVLGEINLIITNLKKPNSKYSNYVIIYLKKNKF